VDALWHNPYRTFRPCLGTFAANTTGKLDVFRHDGNTLGMNGTQVCVFKQSDQVRFRCLLQRKHRRRLKPQVGLEILGDFANKTLEWGLTNKEVSTLLVFADFAESNSAWTISVRLLHSSSSRGRLAGSLGSQLQLINLMFHDYAIESDFLVCFIFRSRKKGNRVMSRLWVQNKYFDIQNGEQRGKAAEKYLNCFFIFKNSLVIFDLQ